MVFYIGACWTVQSAIEKRGRIRSLGESRNKEIFCVGWAVFLSVQGCRTQFLVEHAHQRQSRLAIIFPQSSQVDTTAAG